MTGRWVKIYATTQPHQAAIVQSLLESNQIACVTLDKRDSAYGMFGEVEVYTLPEFTVQALHLIKAMRA